MRRDPDLLEDAPAIDPRAIDPRAIDAHAIDAHAADSFDLPKESVSEEAESRAFLKSLRAERNEMVARESIIAASVALMLTTAVWVGYESPDSAARTAVADAPALAAKVEADAIADDSHIGPPAPPTVEGNIGRAAVLGAVDRQGGTLRRCFALGVEKDPHLSGNVTMKILVGESGAVIGVADVGSTIHDRDVVHCVARSMRTLDLPAPSGGGRALVTYPLDAAHLR